MIKISNHHTSCNNCNRCIIPHVTNANNLHGWAMSQTLPVNGFKWVEELSKIDECFIENYDKDTNKGYFLEADIEYPKNLFNLHSDLPSLTERNKI